MPCEPSAGRIELTKKEIFNGLTPPLELMKQKGAPIAGAIVLRFSDKFNWKSWYNNETDTFIITWDKERK